ncbi:T9SS type A sorting domain-containing protein [candidate division WOR-3 bacterium]|nr:T9SS type A sorting domain-containing protein [candidate division WOR-3 bacterium]
MKYLKALMLSSFLIFPAVCHGYWWLQHYVEGGGTLQDVSTKSASMVGSDSWQVGSNGLVLDEHCNEVVLNATPAISQSEWNFYGIKFIWWINEQIGFIVGENASDPSYPEHQGIILRTQDGGTNWDATFPTVTVDGKPVPISCYCVDFANETYGCVGCSRGYILKTIDGGNNWAPTTYKAAYDPEHPELDHHAECFRSIWVDKTKPDGRNVWATADNSGLIVKTQNGGNSWYHFRPPEFGASDHWTVPGVDNWADVKETSFGIAATDMNNAWVALSSGKIGYTTDGGNTWQVGQFPGPANPCMAQWFYDINVPFWWDSYADFPQYSTGSSGIVSSYWAITSLGMYNPDYDLKAITEASCPHAVGTNEAVLSKGVAGFTHVVSVTTTPGNRYIVVEWTAHVSDWNGPNYYFDIYRALTPEGPWKRVKNHDGPYQIESGGDIHGSWTDYAATYNMTYYYTVNFEYWSITRNLPIDNAIPNNGDSHTQPSTPKNFFVGDIGSDHGGKLGMSWEAVGGVSTYYIYRSPQQNSNQFNSLLEINATGYTDVSALTGYPITYEVRAFDGIAVSEPAQATCTPLDNLAPPQVMNLIGEFDDATNTVSMKWDPVSTTDEPNLGGYWVCPTNTPGVPGKNNLNSLAPIERTWYEWKFTDAEIDELINVYGNTGYLVCAMDRSGNVDVEPWSNLYSLNFPPTTPTGLAVSEFQHTATWYLNPQQDITGYKLRWDNWESVVKDVGNVTSYKWSYGELEDQTTYYIDVRAYDFGGLESEYSGEVSFNTPWLTSDLEYATGHNNARHLVVDPISGDLHLVFSADGKVYYSRSTDNGNSWTYKDKIGAGEAPSIAVSQTGDINIVWMEKYNNGGKYLYSFNLGPPQLLQIIPCATSGINQPVPPASVVDNTDIVHAVVGTYHSPPGSYNIRYCNFPSGDISQRSAWEDVFDDISPYGFSPPSIDVDGIPHVAFGRVLYTIASAPRWIHKVYYATKDGGIWSAGVITSGRNPFICVKDGIIHTAWEYGNDIWYQEGIDGTPTNISNTSDCISTSSQILGGSIITWSEETSPGAQYEVCYKILGESGYKYISNTPYDDKFPQTALSENDICCVWTAQNTSPYEVKGTSILPPDAPTGLTITSTGYHHLGLEWSDNSEPDLAGYKVYYGTSSGSYGEPIDVGNVTSYTLSGLSSGTTYYICITAYDLAGNESNYSPEKQGTTKIPCPFVHIWNGSEFVEDNNILAGSGQGDTITDWYKLTQVPVKKNNRYVMEIREENSEHSWFDKINLIAVDHPDSVMIFTTRDGTILPLVDLLSPILCTSENGEDYTDLVEHADGVYYQGYEDVSAAVKFEEESIVEKQYAIVLRPREKYLPYLDVAKYDGGEYEYIGSVIPREHWSTEAIALALSGEDTTTKIKITWHAPHKLDYIGIGKISAAEYLVKPCPLTAAVHSRDGSVKQKLLNGDEKYAELISGDIIELKFAIPGPKPGWVRDFIFISNGYYTTEENIAMGGAQCAGDRGLPTVFNLSRNVPNPFTSETQIKFALPKKSRVNLNIYDVSGRLVKTLVNGTMEAGSHSVNWDAKEFPSGIYFVKLRAGDNYTSTKKLILMR